MTFASTLLAAFLGTTAFVAQAHDVHGHKGARLERLKAADTNADGMLSRAEAEAALPRLAQRFDAVDGNRDGLVTFDELQAFRAAHRAEHGKRARAFFVKLDADKDGRVSRAEAAGAPRLAGRFEAIDADRDGFVTREELRAAHKAHHEARHGKRS